MGNRAVNILLRNRPPRETGARAMANLMERLRAGNQLQYFDALYVLASYNSQGSIDVPTSILSSRNIDARRNRISNNYHATEILAPLYLFGYGFRGDGTTDMALSLLNPTTVGIGYALNDCHIGLYNRDDISGGIELGQQDTTPLSSGAWIASKYSDNNSYLNLNAAASVNYGNQGDCRGWWYGERVASTGITLYKNNVSLGTIASVSVDIANQPFYALATNRNGAVLGTSESTKKMALCHIGKSGMDRAIVKSAFDAFIIENRFAP